MKVCKIVLILIILLLINIVSSTSYLNTGTIIISNNITYTVNKQIEIVEIGRFYNDCNAIYIDGITLNLTVPNRINVTLNSISLFEFKSYNLTYAIIDLNISNCHYGFKGAKVTDANWVNCKFNITIPCCRWVLVSNYDAKGIPHSIIIAFGAGGLSILIIIWRRRRRRR